MRPWSWNGVLKMEVTQMVLSFEGSKSELRYYQGSDIYWNPSNGLTESLDHNGLRVQVSGLTGRSLGIAPTARQDRNNIGLYSVCAHAPTPDDPLTRLGEHQKNELQ